MARKPAIDVDTATAQTALEQERTVELAARQRQEERERLIAQAHEMIGRIQGVEMLSKMATVATLVWLRDVKAAKLYRDLPNIGTWDEFCKYLKKDRRTVDEDLQNLATFGEEFLETVASLQVGYRDLRKLRHLTQEGSLQVTEDAIEIAGERIPLTPDHKDELQTAIEQLIEEQARVKEELEAHKKSSARYQAELHESMVDLEKDLAKFTKKDEGKGFTLDESALLKKIEEFKNSFDG